MECGCGGSLWWKELKMGLIDEAKSAAENVARGVGKLVDDTRDAITDRIDDVKAEAEIRKLGAEED